ncbi:MAG: transketolase [Acidobacteria bacterium]|nr:transketolase [Acidobacteriota bacterium]
MAVSDQAVLTGQELDLLSINTIRTLSIDAVEKAHSGHPGAPMALAPAAYVLWQQFLRFDPANPVWPNRDRFILSNGHASMLLYSMLYLTGVKSVDSEYKVLDRPSVTLDDIKNFRQLDSRTPGHPEYRLTSGVETTTGPLGQGAGASVGMSMASNWLRARYNRPGFEIFNYNIYTFCSDGDLMEGVGSEAASLAGHLKLPNLCWIYDDNSITLDGPADWSFNEDVAGRFRAYGWHVTQVLDANDLRALEKALREFLATGDRPTLIMVKSHIGYGSPHKQDTNAAHGEPLGADEVKLVKKFYGWPEDAQFLVPEGVLDNFREGIGKRGRELSSKWTELFSSYAAQFPELGDHIHRMQRRELPRGWDKSLPAFPADRKGLATRESSGKVLNAVAQSVPWLIGGAADLATSNKTDLKFEGAGIFEAGNYGGRNIHFGVREHAMGAALNGMALAKVRPFGGTFFNFTDYMRPAMRIASIAEIPTIYVLTHDSIGLGEDGPTHQPIEQLASLRAMPHMIVMRPGDANEVVEAWKVIMALKHNPVSLVLTRQALPTIDRAEYRPAFGVARGGYILGDAPGAKPELILIGTGSELWLCVSAYEKLKAEGVRVRVVSMPSTDIFDMQDEAYRRSVLPPEVEARVSVEAASVFGWERYVGDRGAAIGMTSFGASAPAKDLFEKFGFTVDHVLEVARKVLGKAR